MCCLGKMESNVVRCVYFFLHLNRKLCGIVFLQSKLIADIKPFSLFSLGLFFPARAFFCRMTENSWATRLKFHSVCSDKSTTHRGKKSIFFSTFLSLHFGIISLMYAFNRIDQPKRLSGRIFVSFFSLSLVWWMNVFECVCMWAVGTINLLFNRCLYGLYTFRLFRNGSEKWLVVFNEQKMKIEEKKGEENLNRSDMSVGNTSLMAVGNVCFSPRERGRRPKHLNFKGILAFTTLGVKPHFVSPRLIFHQSCLNFKGPLEKNLCFFLKTSGLNTHLDLHIEIRVDCLDIG